MVVEVVFAAESAVLVAAAAIVLYPLVTHGENVLHSTAAVALAASLLLLTVGTVAMYAGLSTVANAGLLASTIAFAWSQWLFCRDFVRNEDEQPFTFEERSGGFEDAVRE